MRGSAPDAFETLPGADGDAYRALARRWAATVTVVTVARDDAPALDGFTATGFLTVSIAPPIVLVSATLASRAAAMLDGARGLAVNLLAASQRPVADVFATPHDRRGDPFARFAWRPDARGAPLLEGALGAFSATVREVVPAGDHALVLGDVTELHLGSDDAPLVYLARRYGRFTPDD